MKTLKVNSFYISSSDYISMQISHYLLRPAIVDFVLKQSGVVAAAALFLVSIGEI
jgi:hypothetical protein